MGIFIWLYAICMVIYVVIYTLYIYIYIYIYVSFIVYIKTDNIYKDIVKEVETRFDTSKKTITKNLQKTKNQYCEIFKNERGNIFTEEINKIALSSNYYKRMQSIDSIETNAQGTRKDLVNEKKDIK